MTGTGTPENRTRRTLVQRLWPAALGLVVAAATAYGLSDPREVAPVVAASGFVYLVAAALGRPRAAWPAFGVTVVLMTLAKLVELDVVPWILGAALVLLVRGLVRGRTRPGWALPLQSVAMVVLGAAALLAVRLDPTAGGLLVAVALLAHAAWDVHHHRTGRVVTRSLAEFCAVLDIAAGLLVGVLAVTA